MSNRPPSRSFFSPLFVTCGLIVLASAIGLRPALRALAAHYAKHAIALRCSLDKFDAAALASFRPIYRDLPPLPTEAIGTEDVLWQEFQEDTPGRGPHELRLFVTYYSDPNDPVPHTPEVCARQAGYTVKTMTTDPFEVPDVPTARPPEAVHVLDLVRGSERLLIVYLFCVNGEFCHDREQVRWIMRRPGKRYVYFSKIEVHAPYQLDGEQPVLIDLAKQLLREAVPLLLAHHFPAEADLRGP